jgi:hypothetical protein
VSSFHKTIIETLKPLATLSRKTIATRIRHPSLGKQGEVGEALVLAPVGAVDAARELHDALVAAEMLGAGEGKRTVVVREWGLTVESGRAAELSTRFTISFSSPEAFRGFMAYLATIGAIDPKHVPPASR